MSIDRLRYFAAVVETKNLRKASELVGISPPSMSKAISVLEGELGFQLLFPDGRGIGITPRGLEVYRQSASLLEAHRAFFSRVRAPSEAGDQLRMATYEVFSSSFISSFLKSEERFEMLLLEKGPGAIEAVILSGLVDFGLTYVPSPRASLEYREVGAFSMGIYGQKKWAERPFGEWPFAVPTTELKVHSSDVESLDLWPRGAPARKIKYRFELLETALQTARAGLSVLHVPDFIVTLQNEQLRPSHQLVRLPFPPRYRPAKAIKVHLIGRKGAIPDELERKLARFMRSLKR